ncbi:MAG: hypothetical protein KKA65_03775 [Nanoarchaeota archaeon]|nr:hypothetical protein [Nanoarchaeota archaeon]MBU4241815.1 hypothetical protein [Nanoarchaeota archaeon]MBU4352226.1 hypothetical protein [Nanoarchaeota archaeon]MBU4456596.1 hypothetical protein [Nanoarchaeota archaeon]MCG2719825.1 hypothetical protein [Nanoarchaeota archaeon]
MAKQRKITLKKIIGTLVVGSLCAGLAIAGQSMMEPSKIEIQTEGDPSIIGKCYVDDDTLILRKFPKKDLKDYPEPFKSQEYVIQFYDRHASLKHQFALNKNSSFRINCNDGSSYNFHEGILTKREK